MSNIFSIEQEFNAEASDHGRRSISPTQHTQPSPATSPPILRDNSNPTVLLTDAAASLAAATVTTDSNLMMEDDRMNLDNNATTATNNDGKGLISNKAISNVTENQPPPAAGDQNNTLTNVSHINPATGNQCHNGQWKTMMTTPKTMPSCPHPHVMGTQTTPRSNPLHHNININAMS